MSQNPRINRNKVSKGLLGQQKKLGEKKKKFSLFLFLHPLPPSFPPPSPIHSTSFSLSLSLSSLREVFEKKSRWEKWKGGEKRRAKEEAGLMIRRFFVWKELPSILKNLNVCCKWSFGAYSLKLSSYEVVCKWQLGICTFPLPLLLPLPLSFFPFALSQLFSGSPFTFVLRFFFFFFFANLFRSNLFR